MGACCNGKITKNDKIEEELDTKYFRTQLMSPTREERETKILPKIEYEVEKNNFNEMLTSLICKYMDSKVKIKKLSLEQLWNISKFYQDDFTSSEYILYDLRDKICKTENFLKKFKAINYTIEEMRTLSGNRLNSFKKYLDYKNIIFILSTSLVEQLDQILEFLIEIKINCNFYLLDHSLDHKEMTEYNKYLYHAIDKREYCKFPFILLSMRFFPHMKTENFIFFDFFKGDKETKFNNKQEFIMDHKNKDSEIDKFFKHFNCSTILNFQIKQEIQNFISIKSFKLNKECFSINLECLNYQNYFTGDKKDSLLEIIDRIKYSLRKESVFIFYDEDLSVEVLIFLIFLISWKLSDISPKKIKYYLQEQLFFIKGFKEYCQENFYKLLNFFTEDFGLVDQNTVDVKVGNEDYESLRLIKDKVVNT
jgi:hypothetical protein